LITLPALANTFGGIVRPICLAAFRLMMNLNFFGCSGEIAGLGSLQDFVHVICDSPVIVREVRPVGHEPTCIYKFPPSVVANGPFCSWLLSAPQRGMTQTRANENLLIRRHNFALTL
jgi:hypothetical protein